MNFYLIFLAFGIWNGVVTFLLVKSLLHYNKLVKNIDQGNLEKVLEKLLKFYDDNGRQIENLDQQIAEIREKGKGHFQKVGLKRFNPFSEMGGNQSFSLCLLDDDNNGVVFTGLHTRALTRFYVKSLKKGKPIEGKLSKEEREALDNCIKETKKGKNK